MNSTPEAFLKAYKELCREHGFAMSYDCGLAATEFVELEHQPADYLDGKSDGTYELWNNGWTPITIRADVTPEQIDEWRKTFANMPPQRMELHEGVPVEKTCTHERRFA